MDAARHDGARVPGPRRAPRPLRRASAGATSRQLDFYVAFAFWKLACILEGVYARYLAGALGGGQTRPSIDPFRQQVDDAAAQARCCTRRG